VRTPLDRPQVSDVLNGTLEDKMESFFLSETLKYLYLLFDPDDEVYEHGRYVTITREPLACDGVARMPHLHLNPAPATAQVRVHD
jgi:hypothetical protein